MIFITVKTSSPLNTKIISLCFQDSKLLLCLPTYNYYDPCRLGLCRALSLLGLITAKCHLQCHKRCLPANLDVLLRKSTLFVTDRDLGKAR